MQLRVVRVAFPSCYPNAVFWLSLKVFFQIVHNYGFEQRPAQSRQVFDASAVLFKLTVLSVKPELNHLLLRVQLIYYEVGVVLLRSSENHQLEYRTHFLQKGSAEWSQFELVANLVIVNECLVQIEH